MSIYENNIEAIKKCRPDLFAILENFADESAITAGCENIEGRNVLYSLEGDRLTQLDSMYDSAAMVEGYISQLSVVDGARFYIFGFGNGMYIRRLLEELPASARLFVYEPSLNVLKTVLEYFELQSIIMDGRVTIFTPYHEAAGVELFKMLGHSLDYSDIPKVRRFTYPNYDVIFATQYSYFKDRVDEVLTSMESNRSVYERFGEYFAINGLYNIPYVKEGRDIYDLAKRVPDDFPAIIVSTGPSLMKNVELLKEVKNKAFVVATDSAVKVLLLHGIVPDIYVSVDANKSPKHYDDKETPYIPLVGDFSTCRGAMEGRCAENFFARSDNPHILKFFTDNDIKIPKLGTGGSVANTAMSFIAELGLKRIILIGQDLAYTGEKSHADGATRASWGLDLDTNSVMVEGIDGKPIKSSGEFIHYRNWFERTIQVCDDIDVINATEGGARIHGAREMTLREAIDSYCQKEFDITSAIKAAGFMLKDEEKTLFEEYMKKVPLEVEQIASALKDGIRAYDSMYQMVLERKYQNNQFKKLFEKTSEITGSVEAAGSFYYVECMVQKEMTALLKNGSEVKADEREELLDAINAGRERFELLLKGTKLIQDEIRILSL